MLIRIPQVLSAQQVKDCRAALETAGTAGLYAEIYWAGAYRDALRLVERVADSCLERGELARAALHVGTCSRLRAALGDLAWAEQDLVRVAEKDVVVLPAIDRMRVHPGCSTGFVHSQFGAPLSEGKGMS